MGVVVQSSSDGPLESLTHCEVPSLPRIPERTYKPTRNKQTKHKTVEWAQNGRRSLRKKNGEM